MTTNERNAPMNGIERIAAERQRQIDQEGYSPEHDREHGNGDLARAAAVYAQASIHADSASAFPRLTIWPWADEDYKPTDSICCLVKAGALIAAEIDRLLAQAP